MMSPTLIAPTNMTPYQYQGHSTMSSIPAHTQSKKRVRFQPSVTVQPIDCTKTPEEQSKSHYSKDELNTLSLEAKGIRALSKSSSTCSSTCAVHATKHDCLVRLEVDPALRGLERYLCPIRVRNQVLARKALLKYGNKLNSQLDKADEEKLRALAATSAKLSQWSKLVAVETARLDSLRAYEGDYLIPINEPVDISPFPGTTKRRRVSLEPVSLDECSHQSKRRRS